jgi:hypothetical protein
MSKSRPTYDELLVQYKRLAKKADRYMRNLEKLSATEEFKSATRFAYKQAARDAMEWGANPDKPRFDIKPPAKKMQLQAKIHDIESFLAKDTATKKGIVNVYKKSADALNANWRAKGYDLDLKWSDLKTFFESDLYKKLDKKYGSAVAVKAIAKMRKNSDDVLKSIAQSKEKHQLTDENNILVKGAVNRAVREYGEDVKALLGVL